LDKKLAIIGAGNLATRLSIELHNQGIEILQVYSRSVTSALTLAKLIGCTYVTQPDMITSEADIYIVSVSDHAIGYLLCNVNFNHKLVVHTAGSISIDELKNYSSNYGVLYPLQTFSKYREVNFLNIPFCIEANNRENEQILVDLASIISNDVRLITSEQRKQLHLAAVFASNFVNHMYTLASDIIQKSEMSFDILIPLIEEVASKIKEISPLKAQTGPAVRNDKNIINEHLEMLEMESKLKDIYIILSESIYRYHSEKK